MDLVDPDFKNRYVNLQTKFDCVFAMNVIEKRFYFNTIGILGWYLFGTILKRRTISEGNMSIYNLILPVVKLMDFILQGKVGLSAIVVSRKI